jgi:CheY-like chemotaxis protein
MMSSKGPIIFVDDDSDDQFIYEEICLKLGIHNKRKFFRRADEVLTYLRETTDKPFIIFCDINMPEVDGLQLRAQINNEEELRRKSIPFVFYSTAATSQQVRLAYDLTVQGFFIKEPNFADTEATIKLILDYWDNCHHPNSAG